MSQRAGAAASAVISAPFVVCVLVLAAAAVGKEFMLRWAGGAMRKEPLPLRKSLDKLDESRLGDYRVLAKTQMSATVEQALGTHEYIDWMLEDTSVKSKNDPRRVAHLVVTYYTGTQDPVPHTAEVCFLGSGYQPKQAHEDRTIKVPALAEVGDGVKIRVCTFIKTAIFNRDEPTVVYTFHANGKFASDRNEVRKTTTYLFNKHAYFSKVEVGFGGPRSQPANLGREESVAAAAKLLNVVLPLLVEEHWPDWKAVESKESPPAAGGA